MPTQERKIARKKRTRNRQEDVDPAISNLILEISQQLKAGKTDLETVAKHLAQRHSITEEAALEMLRKLDPVISRQEAIDDEIPDSFLEGLKACEEGRVIDMETALSKPPPGVDEV